MEYYGIDWKDEDALLEFFKENHIRYEYLYEDMIMSDNDVKLSVARDDEIIDELRYRKEISLALREMEYLTKEEKKEIIASLCTLNPVCLEDVISEIKEIWK